MRLKHLFLPSWNGRSYLKTFGDKMATSSGQQEILSHGPLLDQDGNLTQAGWSRQPILDCNLEQANFYRIRSLQRFRIKRWDYYGVTTPDFYFSMTIADLGYAGQTFVYFVDFKNGTHIEETVTIPFGSGVSLPRNSTEGESSYESEALSLQFQVVPEGRHLSLNWPKFAGIGIAADLKLRLVEDHESMVVVIPFAQNRFYFNRKVNCMPAEGWVEYRGQRYSLSSTNSLGNMDWGRGIWPYNSFWVWASASGFLTDGRTLGLNLGFGFGDTSRATENALILDGKIHKLGIVDFKYDPTHFMNPWKLSSADDRLSLTFEPFVERVARTNLVIIRSEVHQMFGRYGGRVELDDGERVEFEGLVGFAEEHYARW
jgi:hypothetical protein